MSQAVLSLPSSAKAYVIGRLPFLRRPGGRDAFYLAIEKAINLGIGFFVSIIVIRHLGPQLYGVLSYVSAWVTLLSPLATLAMAGPMVKLLIQEPERTALILSTGWWMRVAASVLSAAIIVALFASGWLGSSGADHNVLTRVAAIAATQYFAQTLDIFENYNQANHRITVSTYSRLYALLIVSPMRLLAAEFDCDVTAFAWLVVLQLLIGFAINYRSVVPSRTRESFRFDTPTARLMLGMGFFIVIAGLLNFAQSRAEMFFLERLAGIAAVGMYSVGLRFVELFDLFGTIAVTIYLPKLLATPKEELANDRALTVTYRLALLLYLACVPLIMLMAGFAYFALGSKFPGIHLLILAMGTRPLFTFLGLTRSMYMLAADRLKYAMLCSATGLAVSIVSGLTLIPIWGYYGAAASAFLSYLMSNLLIDAAFNRRYFIAFLRAFVSA